MEWEGLPEFWSAYDQFSAAMRAGDLKMAAAALDEMEFLASDQSLFQWLVIEQCDNLYLLAKWNGAFSEN